MIRAFVSVAFVLLCIGCRHGPKIERTLSLPSTLEISAVTVEPVSFRWDEPSYRALELSQRMIDEGVRLFGSSLLFFGNWEATGFGEAQPRTKQTPILALLAPYGAAPERLMLFRPWVEVRIQSGATAVQDSSGKTAGKARSEELTYIAHLDVLNADTNEVVAELKGEQDVDPFAEVDDGDPAPGLTRLLNALMVEALMSLRPHFRVPAAPPRAFSGSFLFAPQQTFRFVQVEGKPSLEELMLKGDALDQEVARRRRIVFANPGISEALVAKLSATRGGLYVVDGDLGLRPGDVVLEIDRRPACLQHFHRALLSPVPTELLVRRADGDEGVVVLR